MLAEENFLDFQCPYCQEPVSFPRENAGSVQACPSCTESLVVPQESGGDGGKIPLPITTAKLVLRRFAPGDWKDLLEGLADEDLFRYTEGAPMEEDEVLRWLEHDRMVKLTTPDQRFFLGLEHRETGKLAGFLSLTVTDAQRLQTSLHIVVTRGYQRQGLAAEAVKALLDFCFRGIHLHRVLAQCDSRNVAASRLLEKTGFRREGEFIKDHWLKGEWTNTASYAVLGEEWRAD